ncbi:MAG: hypothetical protein K2I64_04495 [Muribaculaceae bacterium]|nr:hypothetical protein [Muribaculaceae bacterium]
MKKFLILLSIVISQFVDIKATSKESQYSIDRIYYSISDLTEFNIYNYIKENFANRKNEVCIFVGASSSGNNNPYYVLLVVPDAPGDYTSFLKKTSNRYIVINKDCYPAIFDLDFVFADADISSKYVKYYPFKDGIGFEFTFPGDSKKFENISMW